MYDMTWDGQPFEELPNCRCWEIQPIISSDEIAETIADIDKFLGLNQEG